jgi:hypothetical protein
VLVTRRAAEIAAALAALATLAAMASQLPGLRGLLLANGGPLFGDYLAFWSAGKLALSGEAAHVHSTTALNAVQDGAVPGLTRHFPWRSPPPLLLIMAPLAALPYAISAVLFLGASFGFYLSAVRPSLPDRRAALLPAAAPAALLQLGSVQLALAISGFTALAFRWLDRRPVLAAAAIAALIAKPHLAVLWPVLLAVQGRWRTFAFAALFTLLLCLLAGSVFGLEAYGRFLADLPRAQAAIADGALPKETLASLYANLIGLGVPQSVAMAVHLVSAAAALAACIVIFRRNDGTSATAALAAGTLLLSPYLFFYDALLLIVAAVALAAHGDKRHVQAAMTAAFLAGGAQLFVGQVVTLPLVWAASWAMVLTAFSVRGGNGASPPAPAPRT